MVAYFGGGVPRAEGVGGGKPPPMGGLTRPTEGRRIFHAFFDARNHVLYYKTNSFERFRLFRKNKNNH